MHWLRSCVASFRCCVLVVDATAGAAISSVLSAAFERLAPHRCTPPLCACQAHVGTSYNLKPPCVNSLVVEEGFYLAKVALALRSEGVVFAGLDAGHRTSRTCNYLSVVTRLEFQTCAGASLPPTISRAYCRLSVRRVWCRLTQWLLRTDPVSAKLLQATHSVAQLLSVAAIALLLVLELDPDLSCIQDGCFSRPKGPCSPSRCFAGCC